LGIELQTEKTSVLIEPGEQGYEIKADHFTVRYLMEDLPPLETIGARRPVREALEKMCTKNYSQLAVMQGKMCIGSVTLESILCQLRKEDLKGNRALEFMNWPVRRFVVRNPRFVDPDDNILKHVEWMAEKGFFIVGSSYECKAIVTNYDLVHFFENWTKVFLLLREIETNLRFVISQRLKGNRLRKALALLKREHSSPPSSINDLSLDELRQLIHINWKEFKGDFLDEQKIDSQLQKIRDLRNGIFHFRTQTTGRELASIERLRDNYLKLTDSSRLRNGFRQKK